MISASKKVFRKVALGVTLAVTVAPAAVSALVSTAHAERSERFGGDFTTEHSATSHPTGKVVAVFFPSTHELRYTITWDGLSGPVTVAHFHGPAGPGQEADHMITLKGPFKSPFSGTAILTAEQEKALHDGKMYLNLHTAAYPKGEARAQLVSPYNGDTDEADPNRT
ncbi:CHRD domain-containing protein [Acetobacter ascendens]|uniref:CHRD domain-containing protein n=1 Tax=Acetobacter ascendens TaxID=481146 RepID=A0A1D8QZW3_9PROT|nr:CHRD domain-containing protein [Acetobacter ascendens]AOW47864.1 CHRD domain-containing protein [Acetobacter ascendens]AOW50361.1 CHRD domain-containing protein [Acetobacter ascendens]